MYVNPSYVRKLAARLDAPIASYFDGARVAGPVEAPKTPNVVVEEEIRSAIESMKGLHDMREPWVEGSSYKSDKVSSSPFLTWKTFLLIFSLTVRKIGTHVQHE